VIAAIALFSFFGSLAVAQTGSGASRGAPAVAHGPATRSPNTGGPTPVAPSAGANALGATQNGSTSLPTPMTSGSTPEHPGPKTINDPPATHRMHKTVMGPCIHTAKTQESTQAESGATSSPQDGSAPKRSSDCV